ncbi:TIM50 [Lepeophtheirus salmonis]|uniref:Mitochondrial import inner membrane translocase subunit TIM50 n=1 Tax=Lepeophtheirus salmonis TaxID=72036 RepID=A0A7R8HCK3_LEPSM|nr:TIM50 [Lepeophtheirus salmonis]CAF3003963.1 TIM50 [Lepeophtheirus salmonis]
MLSKMLLRRGMFLLPSFRIPPALGLVPYSSQPKFSLADEIMKDKARQEESSSSSSQKDQHGGEEPPKGPKPLSKWEKIGYTFFGVTFVGGLFVNAIIFSLPDRDEEGQNIPDDYSDLPFPSQYYKRLSNKIFKTKKDLEEPFSDKLLPEPLQKPYYQPKYTIFLELTGLLVHATWTHKHGWRFLKRPGVDIFLSQVGYPQFELVVYTTENAMTFFPIIDGLDPEHQHIMHRLFRDATRYHNGHHIKDLNSVNRDPKRVIVVDWNNDSRNYFKLLGTPMLTILQGELQVQEDKRNKELEQKKSSILPSFGSSFRPWNK